MLGQVGGPPGHSDLGFGESGPRRVTLTSGRARSETWGPTPAMVVPWGGVMRTLTVASILLGTVVLGTGAASAALWCTEYGGSGRGGSNCGFYSFEQCMANAWGNGGFCRRNAFEDPYW